jgi:hypothetical protein
MISDLVRHPTYRYLSAIGAVLEPGGGEILLADNQSGIHIGVITWLGSHKENSLLQSLLGKPEVTHLFGSENIASEPAF